MFKKTKLYVGVSLLVQAVCSVVMFFILLGKKKSIAGAFLALAAVSGAAGGYLLYDCKQEEELSFGCVGCDDEDCDCCEFGCEEELDGDLFAREDDEMEVEIVEEAAEAAEDETVAE
jgi:hypothetical protein